MQTFVDLKFADGEYTFRLGLAQISELESKSDDLGKIHSRTLKGRFGFGETDFLPDFAEFRFKDLVEVIRQGLIGGKHGLVDGQDVLVTSARANELIQNYVLDGPERMVVRQTWAIAAAVLDATINGFDPPKKKEPEPEPVAPAKSSTTRRRSRTAR